MELIVLALGWIMWCTLHSALIWEPWTAWFSRRFPELCRFYRLGYNVVALLTLLPVLEYKRMNVGDPWLIWDGPLAVIRFGMFMSALALFAAGAMSYDLRWFAGITQLQKFCVYAEGAPSATLRTDGILGHVRHPWYGGALLLLWSHTRSFDGATIVSSVILSLYVVLGAYLEEQKLVRAYGDKYRVYQESTPMFFPWTRR